MKKYLHIFFSFLLFCLWNNFSFAQTQIKNFSNLPEDIVAKKIAFIDSVRKANNFKNKKQEQDNIYYKSLLEQGYSKQHVDSLHKAADADFILPAWYPSPDEANMLPAYRKYNIPNINVQKNTNTNPSVLTTGLEQDCINGISVCSSSYTQNTSYTGYGSVQEVYNTCLLAKEQSTVWYIFTASSAGSFGFDVLTSHDYDYALYDLTAIGGCSKVPTSTPVRCNFSGTYGNTGLSSSSTSSLGTNISVPASGSPYENGITSIPVGEVFALVLDNFTLDNNGYTINFTGSAVITDNIKPTITSASYNCSNQVTLTFSEPITCGVVVSHPSNIPASLASDGTDFTITPAGFTVSNASPVSSGNTTTQAVLTLSGTPASGVYTIHVGTGSDGNTILDRCDNPMLNTQTATFTYLGPVVTAAAPSSICAGTSSTLSATQIAGATYAWTPSGGSTYSVAVSPNATTVYQCSVTYGGCNDVETTTLTVSSVPIVSISPMNPIICSGTTSLNALAAGGTFPYTYLWSNGQTGATATGLGAGTYTVKATSASGCTSSVATSSVTIAAPGGNYCNIVYVSPTGIGDGSTASNPTDIATALSSSPCGVTIKMATGVYTISNELSVNSNTTIEGGFNSSYTIKSSDMSGGSNSTTIVRDNTPDGGVGFNVTCFDVVGGAANFRFQDLRIEMPGATSTGHTNSYSYASGSQMSNYAINLETGCNNYNIVRCFIDAGTGAN